MTVANGVQNSSNVETLSQRGKTSLITAMVVAMTGTFCWLLGVSICHNNPSLPLTAAGPLPTTEIFFCQWMGPAQAKQEQKEKGLALPKDDSSENKTNKRRLNPLSRFKRKGEGTVAENASKYAKSSSPETVVDSNQRKLIQELANRMRNCVPELDKRVAAVSWSGSSKTGWWNTATSSRPSKNDKVDGQDLLEGYLKVMRWPTSMFSRFPPKLCSKKGCFAEVSVAHTLEWREKYKPWLISPMTIQQNKFGYIYYRGYSQPPSGEGRQSSSSQLGHTLVWYKPSLAGDIVDEILYFRAIFHTLDRAVANCLVRTKNAYGRFNIILDVSGMEKRLVPSFGSIRRGITMMQEHYPDRLGVIFLMNFSRMSEIVFALIRPLIPREVREKMFVVKPDALPAIVPTEFIPSHFGGTDDYQFNPKQYYDNQKLICSEATAKEYLTTMSYHAP